MHPHIAVIAETGSTGIRPVTEEAVACAEQIAQQINGTISVYVLADDPAPGMEQISNAIDTHQVIGIVAEGLTTYNAETYRAVLVRVLSEIEPAYVVIAHTARGIDFAPALAATLDGTCIAGVEKMETAAAGPVFARSILNGKKTARIRPDTRPAVITVSPGMFRPKSPQQQTAEKNTRTRPVSHTPVQIRPLGVKPAAADTGSLDTADVIVAAGNGIGEEANLALVQRLASHFSKSAVAGSRPVCDKQWLPYNRQVGVTGAVVRPRLYIACGISGASQHVAGIREAGFIAAINRDPNAAIFNTADVCIVEELGVFLPILSEQIMESRA
ncbi:MAG: electron transfer flavoprotein subunit alpha/FixB family protein [Thermodesulfobacteriota bacterium]